MGAPAFPTEQQGRIRMKHGTRSKISKVLNDKVWEVVALAGAVWNSAYVGISAAQSEWLDSFGYAAIAVALGVMAGMSRRDRLAKVITHAMLDGVKRTTLKPNDVTVFGWALDAAGDIMNNDPADYSDADRESLALLQGIAKEAGYGG